MWAGGFAVPLAYEVDIKCVKTLRLGTLCRVLVPLTQNWIIASYSNIFGGEKMSFHGTKAMSA